MSLYDVKVDHVGVAGTGRAPSMPSFA